MTAQFFPCASCGAKLQYAPGTSSLTCPYCDCEQAIPEASIAAKASATEELDFEAALAAATAEQTTHEVLTVRCGSCGAESCFAANVTADRCSFCGNPLVAQALSKKAILPRALLPFKIAHEQASARFRDWVGSLWFAPSGLEREAAAGRIDGVYLPFWTYDCWTRSSYRGKRGDDRSETIKQPDGRTTTLTRTDWTSVSGNLEWSFNDVLVAASRSLPTVYLEALEPWDLKELVPYDASYLSGFRTESYALDLRGGFETGRRKMAESIRVAVARRIGGDHQIIESVDTSYRKLTFKHLLLPVWISSYRYRAHVFRFLVNARTGELQGERPWSWIKILLAALAAALALAMLLTLLD